LQNGTLFVREPRHVRRVTGNSGAVEVGELVVECWFAREFPVAVVVIIWQGLVRVGCIEVVVGCSKAVSVQLEE
jgi:hypothetical protein